MAQAPRVPTGLAVNRQSAAQGPGQIGQSCDLHVPRTRPAAGARLWPQTKQPSPVVRAWVGVQVSLDGVGLLGAEVRRGLQPNLPTTVTGSPVSCVPVHLLPHIQEPPAPFIWAEAAPSQVPPA